MIVEECENWLQERWETGALNTNPTIASFHRIFVYVSLASYENSIGILMLPLAAPFVGN